MKFRFKNLLKKKPTCQFIVVNDINTHKLTIIANKWLIYDRGSFAYPSSKKLKTMTGEEELKEFILMNIAPTVRSPDWTTYRIQTIYNESGK